MLDPPVKDSQKVADEWFEQRLDHFDSQNTERWMQRYFSSFEYYEEGGPIFIQIGGEGPGISSVWLNYGAWIEWAQREKAALFILEHRYYGESHPKPTLTTEDMKWLSSRQAQNDVAYFVESMTKTHKFTGPWIAFGGSYPGSMVAWAREKYPHLIKGGVSSSGPLLAKVNFFEYLEVVYEALDRVSPYCNVMITNAIQELELMFEENNYESFQEMFSLCKPFDGNSEDDVANFFASLVGILQGAVQYDFNGAINCEDVCQIMEDDSLGTSLERMIALNKYNLDLSQQECLPHTYQALLEYLAQVEYGKTGGYRQWIYQTCTEFGWYQSSDQPGHPYGTKFPVEFSVKICPDLFGDIFSPEYIESLIQESNAYYGATNIDVTNVVFVHGSIDPWHAMGRLTDVNEKSPAFIIDGTSHCVDMYANSPGDPEELQNTRAIIGDLVSKWIQEANP